MASEPQPVDEDGIYFTSKESIDKAIQQRKLDAGIFEEEPEYGEEIFDPPDRDHSNNKYYENDDIGGEYVLPQQKPKPTHSQPRVTPKLSKKRQQRVTPKVSKKRDVEDLYDEDHYALPDVHGCVTIGAGIQKNAVVGKDTNISSERKECKLSGNQMKITGVVVALLVVGGIGGAVVTIFTGITSLFSDMQ